MKKMLDCPFCNIDHVKTMTLFEDLLVRVILSNPSLMPGHLLIIPKRHILNINELSKEEVSSIFENLNKFQKVLLKNNEGCDIRQNFRPFIKQSQYKVDHLHFHLIPRNNEDELYSKSMIYERDVFRFLSQEEMNKLMGEMNNAN